MLNVVSWKGPISFIESNSRLQMDHPKIRLYENIVQMLLELQQRGALGRLFCACYLLVKNLLISKFTIKRKKCLLETERDDRLKPDQVRF